MNKIVEINQVADYNKYVGADTLHPLVSVIDFSKLPPIRYVDTCKLYGFYAIYLRGAKFSDLKYGESTYDYQEDSLVFVAPGQVMGSEADGQYHKVNGYILAFHPDLLRGTVLENRMKDYSYFSYSVSEALYPSAEEKDIVIKCFQNIYHELLHRDEQSDMLIVDYIRLLLDFCVRFYDRQFTTRKAENNDIFTHFQQVIGDYLCSSLPVDQGLPSVQYCADQLFLSANYLSDLIKKETGISALKHIHRKIFDMACKQLHETDKSVSEIATTLGFQYSQHFSRWFKKKCGCTPGQYRIIHQ